MTVESVLRDLDRAGIDIRLEPDGQLTAPAGVLTDEQRQIIKAHRAEIIDRLREAQALANECLRLAMARCNQFGDGPQAREAMRRDVLQTPPRLLRDLLAHFQGVTSEGERDAR